MNSEIERAMGFVVSIILIAVGFVLALAVHPTNAHPVDVNTVRWILVASRLEDQRCQLARISLKEIFDAGDIVVAEQIEIDLPDQFADLKHAG